MKHAVVQSKDHATCNDGQGVIAAACIARAITRRREAQRTAAAAGAGRQDVQGALRAGQQLRRGREQLLQHGQALPGLACRRPLWYCKSPSAQPQPCPGSSQLVARVRSLQPHA